MNLHEYQTKALLAQAGAPVLEGRVVRASADAEAAAKALGGALWAVKAQIHAGGRGKAGGVKLARSPEEARAAADAILGATLITPQTGPEGRLVRTVYVEKGAAIKHEFYLSLLVDRGLGRLAFVVSRAGGMDIEQVAATTPEAITVLPLDPLVGCRGWHGARLATALGLTGKAVGAMARLATTLARVVLDNDLALLEINPLAQLEDGSLVCLDAKASVDDNALFRHPALAELRDEHEEDPMEARARAHDLSYVRLEGSVGCMVNGAGLAMATMDMVGRLGGSPANFLDVGGGASAARVAEAFRIILADSGVRAILVNIFGGILRCDIIAEGVVAAAREIGLQVPLVARLAGAAAAEGQAILDASGLAIETADDLEQAARRAVALALEAR